MSDFNLFDHLARTGAQRDASAHRAADRRERIATACLAGMLAADAGNPPDRTRDNAGAAAVSSVRFADALIAVLDEPPPTRHLPTGGAE